MVSIGLHDFMGRESAGQEGKDLVLVTRRAQSGCGITQPCSGLRDSTNFCHLPLTPTPDTFTS